MPSFCARARTKRTDAGTQSFDSLEDVLFDPLNAGNGDLVRCAASEPHVVFRLPVVALEAQWTQWLSGGVFKHADQKIAPSGRIWHLS